MDYNSTISYPSADTAIIYARNAGFSVDLNTASRPDMDTTFILKRIGESQWIWQRSKYDRKRAVL